jgi:hypothetical protein
MLDLGRPAVVDEHIQPERPLGGVCLSGAAAKVLFGQYAEG